MVTTIETNAKQVSETMMKLFVDQVPFATARAVNTTVLEAQRVQRAHDLNIFAVRNKRFVDLAVKIRREDFATKKQPWATMRIEPPGGAARADIITKFEAGGTKLPFGSSIAIPMIRRTGRGVPANLRPGALFRGARTRGRVTQGREGSFLIRTGKGRGVILQRTHRVQSSSIKTRKTTTKGREGVRLLYVLVPRAQIRDALDFVQNAAATVTRMFPAEFEREFAKAVRTARPR